MILPQQIFSARATTPASVPASRKGRRWLYVFLLVGSLLVAGLAATILPLVKIKITPRLETITVAPALKIDLDINTPLPDQGVVPGHLVVGESRATLEREGWLVLETAGQVVVFSQSDLDQVTRRWLSQAAGVDFELLPPTISVEQRPATRLPSGRSFNLPLIVKSQAYRHLPIKVWQQELPGLTIKEAEDRLSTYPGVGSVTIKFIPSFLARLSQKIPNHQSSLSITIDIK